MNLHKPAAEDGPNFSAFLDSDLLWIAPSLDPLLCEGDDIEIMDFVSDLLSADPPVDFTESSANLKVHEEVASLTPGSQVGSQYEARDLCSKAKGSRGGAGVRQPHRLKPLSGRHSLPQSVVERAKPGPTSRRAPSLEEFALYSFSLHHSSPSKLSLKNVNGIRDPVKRRWSSAVATSSLLRFCLSPGDPLLMRPKLGQWFSASGLLTVMASGTVSSCGQVILYHPFSLLNFWAELDGRLLIAEFCRRDATFRILGSHVCMHVKKTPNVIVSLRPIWIFLICQLLLFCAVTSTWCLTELKFVVVLTRLLLFAKASSL